MTNFVSDKNALKIFSVLSCSKREMILKENFVTLIRNKRFLARYLAAKAK